MKKVNNEEQKEDKKSVRIPNRCPDYDEDCDTTSFLQAQWCFLGCCNHPCGPKEGIGTAKGYCPIIHKDN